MSLIAAFIVYWQGMDNQVTEKGTTDLTVVDELLALITEQSVYDTPSKKLVEGALRGMASAINDPYSTYYSEQEAALHKQTLAGKRVGIGIELSDNNGKFVVISPVKSSPAEKAGIRPLDELIQVNDVRLDGKSMGEVVQLIQGKAGEKVELVLYRPSLDRHLKISVKRQAMKNETVHSEIITVEDTKIGYMTVSMFGEETAEEWQKALQQLTDNKIKALVIDVRDNPGGYLHSVAQMMSVLEPNEKIFAYMQNNEGTMETLKTVASDELKAFNAKISKLPITILQNEGSASASEVFSGAMQSWGRATIIGVTSFGKGTVQQTWSLKNGGELKLSTNKWLTPKKEWIHGIGIKPDLEVVQHPLYAVETKTLTGRYELGDFSEEIAYSQLVLNEFGYNIVRRDGFFDKDTAEAVTSFREQFDLPDGNHLDEVFFGKLTEQLQLFKEQKVNDMPLQMGLSFLMHQLDM